MKVHHRAEPVEPVIINGINKDVCGQTSQRLSRPILWIVTLCATWTHTTAVCILMVALTRLQLPTLPLIHAICDITVIMKKVAQNPAVIASYQK